MLQCILEKIYNKNVQVEGLNSEEYKQATEDFRKMLQSDMLCRPHLLLLSSLGCLRYLMSPLEYNYHIKNEKIHYFIQ